VVSPVKIAIRGPAPAKVSRPRAPWGSISRQQIVDAALKVVKAGRYEQMTIRSLAGEMGVAPMSLYRYVRDRDDLLDEVVDRLLVNAWRPRGGQDNWRAWVADAADKLRRFLVAQPAALHVYLRHPVVSAAAATRMEAMLRVLGRAGLDAEATRSAYAAIHTYTVGFAALEASRSGWVAPDDAGDLANQLAAYTSSGQFAEGLRYLLEGIEHRHRTATTDPRQR
jgi:TetR/AcrR family transcriptional regulator, tetracycline repressor protein